MTVTFNFDRAVFTEETKADMEVKTSGMERESQSDFITARHWNVVCVQAVVSCPPLIP